MDGNGEKHPESRNQTYKANRGRGSWQGEVQVSREETASKQSKKLTRWPHDEGAVERWAGRFSCRRQDYHRKVQQGLEVEAAKSLQSCPTLCDPIDGSPLGSPVPGILQARTLEWVAISFSNTWKWKVKVKLLSHVRLLATPWTAAHQASPSMGGGRNTYKVWAAEKTTWPEESVGDRQDPKAFRPTQFWPDAKRREATPLTCPEHLTATFSAAIPFTLKSARVTTSCYRNQNSGLLGPQEWVGWHRSSQEKARGNFLHWQKWAASLQERGPCGVSLHTRADTRLHCTTYRPSVRKEQGRISVWTTNHGQLT